MDFDKWVDRIVKDITAPKKQGDVWLPELGVTYYVSLLDPIGREIKQSNGFRQTADFERIVPGDTLYLHVYGDILCQEKEVVSALGVFDSMVIGKGTLLRAFALQDQLSVEINDTVCLRL